MGLFIRKSGCDYLKNTLIFVLSALLLSAVSLSANAVTTTDPNHKGWSGKHPRTKQVDWKPVTTKCPNCVKITEQYNQTVQELLKSRYWVHFWREVQANREKGKEDPFWPGKGDISDFEGKAVGANLELMEYQSAQLELHNKAVLALEQQAQYLAQAISDCEKTACPDEKATKFKAITIGGEKTEGAYQPDVQAILKQYGIAWAGPYRTNCRPCQSIVAQLNALPGWVVRAHMRLQRAEMLLAYSELVNKSNKVTLEFIEYTHPDKTDYSNLANQVATIKAEINALKNLFNSLITQLADCEKKYCPAKTDEDIGYLPGTPGMLATNCPDPAASEAITVGANSDVGTSADFKEKAKKKMAGLATKAITGLLGIGGGGGGSDDPGLYKDPIKSRNKIEVEHKDEKREIKLGGAFFPEGLLISTEIEKAPNKGTFQTAYLENIRGWQLKPVRLYMYEIWANWKLSVSWTRDTFVDGELVKHEQGGWTESWRELIAKGEEVEYAEVPIWEQLGFNTAVSGARSLGTLFEISPEMLASEPINLVIHVTDPKEDPVVTFPYVFQLSLSDKGEVVIEEVDDTMAATGAPCNAPPPAPLVVIDSTPTATTPTNQEAPSYCPDNWICMEGKTCPPVDNCTIAISETDSPVATTPGEGSGDDIEEIEVTGSRIRSGTTNDPTPTTISDTPGSSAPENNSTPESDDPESDIEEIEVTGSRRTSTDDDPISVTTDDILTPGNSTPASNDHVELEEVVVTGTHIGSTEELTYGHELTSQLQYGTDLQLDLGGKTIIVETDDDLTTGTPPTIYGEELEEPPIVGIVLRNDNRRWVPVFDKVRTDHTFVTAKIYVPDPSNSNRWIPAERHVQRKMEITFIARSNETGKAMNADLPRGPQDAPDLYFDPSRNAGVECRDDPTGKGHFGTCKTKSEHNEYSFAISNEDYGSFSRLDVSCEDCVPLTLVAGLFPQAFNRTQTWEVAVEERNQEKRAVYVPHDTNKNQISDGYPPDIVKTPSAVEDNESVPTGNGKSGDGLSAYEEYRGFITLSGRHQRTSWDKKTLLVDNAQQLTMDLFETASGLDVVQINADGHRSRIVNFNAGHAKVVDQHGLLLRMNPSLDDRFAGLCDCDRERPKGANRVMVKPKSRHSDTVSHELGHAVGMEHHGNVSWPTSKENIRVMTSGFGDMLPGRVHSSSSLCGISLPHKFYVGTKGDQASGNHQCIMKYEYKNYVYEQDGGDYDCMPAATRSLFDSSAQGTGPNGFNRTAGNATHGDCMSQIWINSQ